MTIRVDGLDGLLEKLDSIADSEKYEKALGKACAVVERAAKEKAPKGTGELRRSITSEIRGDGLIMEGVVFTPLEYAPYVEYGTGLFAESGGRKDVPWHYKDDKGEWHTTSGMSPRPYMRPALDENRENIIKVLEEALKDD